MLEPASAGDVLAAKLRVVLDNPKAFQESFACANYIVTRTKTIFQETLRELSEQMSDKDDFSSAASSVNAEGLWGIDSQATRSKDAREYIETVKNFFGLRFESYYNSKNLDGTSTVGEWLDCLHKYSSQNLRGFGIRLICKSKQTLLILALSLSPA